MLLNFSKPKYYYLFITLIMLSFLSPAWSFNSLLSNELIEVNRGRLDFWENITGEPGQWKLEIGISKIRNKILHLPWEERQQNGYEKQYWFKIDKYFNHGFFISYKFPKERKVDNTLSIDNPSPRSIIGEGDQILLLGKTFSVNNFAYLQIYGARIFPGTFKANQFFNTGNRWARYLLGGIWHHKYKNFALTLNYQYAFMGKSNMWVYFSDKYIIDPACLKIPDVRMFGIFIETKLRSKLNIGVLGSFENETSQQIILNGQVLGGWRGGKRWSNGVALNYHLNKKSILNFTFINQTKINIATKGNFIELKYIYSWGH